MFWIKYDDNRQITSVIHTYQPEAGNLRVYICFVAVGGAEESRSNGIV